MRTIATQHTHLTAICRTVLLLLLAVVSSCHDEPSFNNDPQGNFVQIVRCEESATHGQVGPQGVSSHWQELGGSRWF